ncbi:MAG: hypothetical protein A2516_11025 [Alphaproteobacteria bacterium RIFOXYD12_FULL_60_8]|nr:MAG: hypothetical protein A2516_11025 [Alphaproteobacteria bacterium RIFOXYD12_FULL_60_8]
MAKSVQEPIRCGQGQHCARCSTHNAIKGLEALTLTRNQQGRCDFYEGPGMVLNVVKIEGSPFAPPQKR